jgi:AcrR family transcriptional regulator
MEVKDRIIAQSMMLFLRYGIKSITMDDIARELGMSKKTLYQYVDNKADLIENIIRQHIDNEKMAITAIRKFTKDAIEEMLMIAKHVIQLLRETPPSMAYDLQKHYRPCWDLMEKFNQKHIYNIIKENIDNGIKQGIYRADINSDIVAKLYVAKSSFVVDEELFPLSEYNKETLFKEYIDYHIHGIASPKGLKLLEKHTKIQS